MCVAEARHTILDVLRIDDPAYQRPLVVGTTARELTTAEFLRAYPHRWPVETNFFVGYYCPTPARVKWTVNLSG